MLSGSGRRVHNLCAGCGGAGGCIRPPAHAQSADDPATVYVGVMTPGSAIEAAAIEQSITDVNDMLANIGAEWRLEAVYPDGATGLAEFITMYQEDGVMAFVGPGDAVSLLHAKEGHCGHRLQRRIRGAAACRQRTTAYWEAATTSLSWRRTCWIRLPPLPRPWKLPV